MTDKVNKLKKNVVVRSPMLLRNNRKVNRYQIVDNVEQVCAELKLVIIRKDMREIKRISKEGSNLKVTTEEKEIEDIAGDVDSDEGEVESVEGEVEKKVLL